MGWTYPYGCTLRSLIKERTENHEHTTKDGVTITWTCLKKCFRGNICHSGTLWTVWERAWTKDGKEVRPRDRFIGCDLLRCYSGEWGYKDMCESMHPYYYNCPWSYLKMTPCSHVGWRLGVIAYHARRKRKLAEKKRRKAKLAAMYT